MGMFRSILYPLGKVKLAEEWQKVKTLVCPAERTPRPRRRTEGGCRGLHCGRLAIRHRRANVKVNQESRCWMELTHGTAATSVTE